VARPVALLEHTSLGVDDLLQMGLQAAHHSFLDDAARSAGDRSPPVLVRRSGF
jgi:hypothetical protein